MLNLSDWRCAPSTQCPQMALPTNTTRLSRSVITRAEVSVQRGALEYQLLRDQERFVCRRSQSFSDGSSLDLFVPVSSAPEISTLIESEHDGDARLARRLLTGSAIRLGTKVVGDSIPTPEPALDNYEL